eukprot:gene2369-2928_t
MVNLNREVSNEDDRQLGLPVVTSEKYPYSVPFLKCFSESTDPIVVPKGVKYLTIEYYTDDRELGQRMYDIPSTVECLIFVCPNQDSYTRCFNMAMVPSTVRKLVFTGIKHKLTKGMIPSTVTNLILGDVEDTLEIGAIPDTVVSLGMGQYNGPYPVGLIPDSVKFLFISNGRNLEVGSIPSSVVLLDCPQNGCLVEGIIPNSVRYLFVTNILHPISQNQIPESVVYLYLDSIFTPLDTIHIPQSVTHVYFGTLDNQERPPTLLFPSSITHLCIESDISEWGELDDSMFPKTIKYLYLKMNKYLEHFKANSQLKCRIVPSFKIDYDSIWVLPNFDRIGSMNLQIFQHIEKLWNPSNDIDEFHYLVNESNLNSPIPNTVTHLTISCTCNQNFIDSIPPSVHSLNIQGYWQGDDKSTTFNLPPTITELGINKLVQLEYGNHDSYVCRNIPPMVGLDQLPESIKQVQYKMDYFGGPTLNDPFIVKHLLKKLPPSVKLITVNEKNLESGGFMQ